MTFADVARQTIHIPGVGAGGIATVLRQRAGAGVGMEVALFKGVSGIQERGAS